MSSTLPSGWVECTMGDISTVVGGGTPDASDPLNFSHTGGVAWLTPADLSKYDDIYIARGSRFLTPQGFKGSSAKLMPKGTVLFSSRAPIGYVAIAASEISTNQGFKSFICKMGIHPEYVYFYLKFAKHLAEELASGTTFPEISGKNAARISVRLAPSDEQERIAIKLANVLRKVDACNKRLMRIPTILKRFRQSVLAAACSGRLTADWREANPDVESAATALNRAVENSKNVPVRRGVPEQVAVPDLVKEWELPDTWASISTAALLRCGALVDVKDGNHGANHPVVSEFTETGMPFITAAQVNRFRIDYDGAYKISGLPLQRIRVGFAQYGDVIYTHKGSVGRVAVADRECVLTPQTTYYRVSSKILINKYLMLYLASSGLVEQVAVVKEQTTRDFVPISEQYLLFHRIPPLLEQQEIVRRVESLFTLADQLEARYKKGKAYVDKLTQSILAKAFRGELVPQDPNDEPAEKLLERIRAEKTPAKKRRSIQSEMTLL